ncbi:MAG: spore coat polysaccharide biosynthesis predicted glycosyltransferase SpsG [Oleiphilaceae bacterium]|jgi:spore coat polysaccharide biosynthesis predicted glycosyltransferase SpsG
MYSAKEANMANVFPPRDLLTSQQVMALKEAELVGKLKDMQTSELERHAENIMKEMGSSDYSQIMSSVMKALHQESQKQSQFEIVQKTLEELLPNKAYFSDIYARLAAIVMSIIARKFKAML